MSPEPLAPDYRDELAENVLTDAQGLRLLRVEVIEFAAARSVRKQSDVEACAKWLREEVFVNPPTPERSKARLREEVRQKWPDLSDGDYEDARKLANPPKAWTKPGRRRTG